MTPPPVRKKFTAQAAYNCIGLAADWHGVLDVGQEGPFIHRDIAQALREQAVREVTDMRLQAAQSASQAQPSGSHSTTERSTSTVHHTAK